MAKTKYMIVAGASVVIVRDGKRVPISPGGGEEFTEAEIAQILAASPGALRSPINESRARTSDLADDDGDDGDTASLQKDTTAGAKQAKVQADKPKPTKKAKAAAAADAEPNADATGDDDI